LNTIDHPNSLQFTALAPWKGRTPDEAFAAIEKGRPAVPAPARPKGPQFEVNPASRSSWLRQRLIRMRG
jgi:hypothetical protein